MSNNLAPKNPFENANPENKIMVSSLEQRADDFAKATTPMQSSLLIKISVGLVAFLVLMTVESVMDQVWELSRAPLDDSVKSAIATATDHGNTRW